MIIKVCGISTKENLEMLCKAPIDMVGLNFYPPSVRYIDQAADPSLFDILPKAVKRVGVFVNESPASILSIASTYKLDFVQLHGDEDALFCANMATKNPIIKVFRVGPEFDFREVEDFQMASYFLFDTFTKDFGGSGKKFNWEVLKKYDGDIPFLLSGGIGPDDTEAILHIDHPKFSGIDINSKFENAPGIKDPNLISPFLNQFG